MLRVVAAVILLALPVCIFSAGAVGTAFAEDTVFRCGGETVSIGDSRYTVQKICGKPSKSESISKDSKGKKQKQPKGDTSGSSSGKLQKWTYDRGYGDYVYVLIFANDKLKRIEKSGRAR